MVDKNISIEELEAQYEKIKQGTKEILEILNNTDDPIMKILAVFVKRTDVENEYIMASFKQSMAFEDKLKELESRIEVLERVRG